MSDKRAILYRKERYFSVCRVSVMKKIGILILLILSTFLTSCADDLNRFISELQRSTSFTGKNGTAPLDDEELAILLISCIADTTNQKTQPVYEKIPRSQIAGISFSSFDAYIRGLRRMADSGGIRSFRFPEKEEKSSILEEIENNANDYSDLIAETFPIEIKGNSEERRWYFFLQRNEKGQVYISPEWVEGCLSVYQYASLYFHAIEGQNRPAVETLLAGTIVPEIDGNISSLVVDYKAQAILSYYQRHVRESYENYRLESLDISQLTYEQPNFYEEGSETLTGREVRFIRKSSQVISVKDTISSPLKTQDFSLYKSGEELPIRIGEQTSDSIVQEHLGKPLVLSVGSVDETTELQSIVVGYPTVSLTVTGKMAEDGTWHGQIVRIRLRDNNVAFSLGANLSVGMELDSLLRLYPFADLEKYALEVSVDEKIYRMTFSIDPGDGGYVYGINLEII